MNTHALRRHAVSLAALIALVAAGAGDPACAAAPETPEAHTASASASASAAAHPVPGPAPVAARHHGGLYRISGGGRVAYLFGTVHVGERSFYPMAPEAERALRAADHVVVELDTRSDDDFIRALDRHGRYAPGDGIARHIAPDTLARLRTALHREGVSLASVAHLKPWLLANLLLGLALERQGYRRSEGVESALLARAGRRGTRVAQLESADFQLALFDSMNPAESERYLRETLAGLSDGSLAERARRAIEAWRSGDAVALDAVLRDATAGASETAEFTRRKLLGRRNPDMAAQIDQLMGEGGVLFVGVGLLHLLGDNGLPQLLAQRGYLVERVY
ncbi:TraB/GumN family protein [Massilia sp. Leaf139]|uniref:TraB/GumN family protein n=1 Tax=Massilia sp. Leaf139 TaxID=1736272 RepID=UPI0009E6C299|nr:TraB/GumN family protein [Massilia sp. Leaf139]